MSPRGAGAVTVADPGLGVAVRPSFISCAHHAPPRVACGLDEAPRPLREASPQTYRCSSSGSLVQGPTAAQRKLRVGTGHVPTHP